MSRITLTLLVALAGCASEASETSEDHGHDAVLELEGDLVSADLTRAVVHEAPIGFVRLGLTYDAPAGTSIEVSTSADAERWSEWSAAVIDPATVDPEHSGTHTADLDVADGEARFFRMRAAGEMPTYLVVSFLDAAEIEAALEGEDDGLGPSSVAGEDEDVAGSVLAASSFRRYRFDQGKVGRAWLWLLRAARNRGWSGHLAGPRTGLRTYAQQNQLWRAYQNGTGAPAFPPWGPSRHLIRNVKRRGTWYQACDTQDVPRLITIARRLGVSLHRPYGHEPWHVEARRPFGAPRGWRP
jgi:hypothetical protein